MKSGIQDIVGKTISDIIVVECDTDPRNQVFIVFSDDTYFEFYGKSFDCTSDVYHGNVDEVIRYFKRDGARITQIYPETETPKSTSDHLTPPVKQMSLPGFSKVSTLGERVFLLLARQWRMEYQMCDKDKTPPRSLDIISLSCLLLAVEWGGSFTNAAFEQIHANMEASEDRGNWGWLDQIPWRLCQISQTENPSESHEVDSLVERLTHPNSSIRCWMMEIGWIIRSWLDESKTLPPLLKNLADTLAWPFMAAGLAAAIITGEDIEEDGGDKFYKIAEDFDFLDFQEQYLDRLNYIKEHGIDVCQSSFWMLENQCRRMISGAAFGQSADAQLSNNIGR